MANGIERVREAKEASDRAWNGESVEQAEMFVSADDIFAALLQLDDRLQKVEDRSRYEQLR